MFWVLGGIILMLVEGLGLLYYLSRYREAAHARDDAVAQYTDAHGLYRSLQEELGLANQEIRSLRQHNDEKRGQIRHLLATCRDPRQLNHELNRLFADT